MNALIQPGRILAGRYRIDQQIGVGGMAVVYRATDLNTQHFVAVKVLKPEYNQDAEYVARFQREAEAASKMTHHNIVNLLDVGMDSSGNRYLIMEYVEGADAQGRHPRKRAAERNIGSADYHPYSLCAAARAFQRHHPP